jgi:rubredoxin
VIVTPSIRHVTYMSIYPPQTCCPMCADAKDHVPSDFGDRFRCNICSYQWIERIVPDPDRWQAARDELLANGEAA